METTSITKSNTTPISLRLKDVPTTIEKENVGKKRIVAQKGDIVTINLKMEIAGDYVIEPLFDMYGQVTFALGYGNYVPGLHSLVEGMSPGESIQDSLIDAGWGAYNPDLVATMKFDQVRKKLDVSKLKVGKRLYLPSGASCLVTEVTDDSFKIDANSPMAGSSYSCSLEVLRIHPSPKPFVNVSPSISHTIYSTLERNDIERPYPKFLSPQENEDGNSGQEYNIATFALGCFWGVELEFMRLEGVVGTKVGFTGGFKLNPSYEDVCNGETGHAEAVMIVFDPKLISYEKLVLKALDRLGDDMYLIDQVGNDKGSQYRHGIHYHDLNQYNIAKKVMKRFGQGVQTELEPAKAFYDAEDYHQQYLLKGGQSAKKNAKEPIRCYG